LPAIGGEKSLLEKKPQRVEFWGSKLAEKGTRLDGRDGRRSKRRGQGRTKGPIPTDYERSK